MWSGHGDPAAWHRLLAFAPPLYVLNNPLAGWTATALQLGFHGWLALTENTPITQGLLAATALLFRSDDGRVVDGGPYRIGTGEIMTASVALMCASMLVLPLLGFTHQARRVQLTLASVGLDLTTIGATHHFDVVSENPASSSPLVGTWFDRRWPSRLDNWIATFEARDTSPTVVDAEHVITPILSTFCSKAASGPERRLIATDRYTQETRTVARFYCDDGKVVQLSAPCKENGSAKYNPYTL